MARLLLSGAAEDTARVISVLERLAELPVTTVKLEIVYRFGARENCRDRGERTNVLIRVTGTGQKPAAGLSAQHGHGRRRAGLPASPVFS